MSVNDQVADLVAELRANAKRDWEKVREALCDENPVAARRATEWAEQSARLADQLEAEPDSPASLAILAECG